MWYRPWFRADTFRQSFLFMLQSVVSRRFALCSLIVTICLGCVVASAVPGYTNAVSAELIRLYSAKFGTGARERLVDWKAFPKAQGERQSAERDRLVTVNAYLNRIRFISDMEHWGAEDYWATPAESVASNGADCEDFAIAKYFLLKELGVPQAKLRIVYVKAVKLNQAHMVLAYYPTPSSEPLILDNLEGAVRLASQRTDLVPVYSFNDEEVWIESRGKAGSPKQIRNWTSLLDRLDREARTL